MDWMKTGEYFGRVYIAVGGRGKYLAALRQLLEQHAHADVVGLLGEV